MTINSCSSQITDSLNFLTKILKSSQNSRYSMTFLTSIIIIFVTDTYFSCSGTCLLTNRHVCLVDVNLAHGTRENTCDWSTSVTVYHYSSWEFGGQIKPRADLLNWWPCVPFMSTCVFLFHITRLHVQFKSLLTSARSSLRAIHTKNWCNPLWSNFIKSLKNHHKIVSVMISSFVIYWAS